MAKVISYVPYTNGAGKYLSVEVDVTPSWWERRLTTAYGRVADLIAKSDGQFRAMSLHLERVTVSAVLYESFKVDGEKVENMALEPRIKRLMQGLEALDEGALAGEYACPGPKRMFEILQDPDPRLREVALAVGEVTPDVLEFCTELLNTLTHGSRDGSIGLAATQVGVAKRVFVMLESTKKRGLRRHTFIDPVITKKTGEASLAEGCLSFPAEGYVRVPRAAVITLEWTTREGTRKREIFQGLYAICVQHEIDHLDGKVMTDYGELVTKETDPALKKSGADGLSDAKREPR